MLLKTISTDDPVAPCDLPQNETVKIATQAISCGLALTYLGDFMY